MKGNKKGSQIAVLLVFILALTGFTQVSSPEKISKKKDTNTTIVAGVMKEKFIAEQQLQIARSQGDVVSAPAEAVEQPVEEPVESELTEEEKAWQNQLMAVVDSYLNVREAADENSAVVGKLYVQQAATIVAEQGEWIQITSGNVNGFVKASYCVTGKDALARANQVCKTYAKSTVDGLRVRESQSTESGVLKALSANEASEVDTNASVEDGWVAVKVQEKTGYVSKDYVSVARNVGTAITIQEEQERIAKEKAAKEEAARKAAEKKAAAEKAAAKKAAEKKPQRTQGSSVAASVDEVTLLAALIQCEAGSEIYEGKIAVGAVVMNRVKSGAYPGSVRGVIYQSGQFPPATNGKVASVIAKGVSSSCLSAAAEAINGVDNTNGAKYFKRRGNASGVVIGNHVFF